MKVDTPNTYFVREQNKGLIWAHPLSPPFQIIPLVEMPKNRHYPDNGTSNKH
jgi:hypothetical protein